MNPICLISDKGYIEHQVLKKFLEDNFSNSYLDYGKIVLLHHHCDKFFENENYSWSKVEAILNKYNFNVFIHGHTHNDISKENDDGEINRFIGVCSFAKKDNSIINSYNLFFNRNTENEFLIHTYHYEFKNTAKPYWQYQSNIKGSKRYFKIYSKPINLDTNLNEGSNSISLTNYDPEKLGDDYSLNKFSFKETDKQQKIKLK